VSAFEMVRGTPRSPRGWDNRVVLAIAAVRWPEKSQSFCPDFCSALLGGKSGAILAAPKGPPRTCRAGQRYAQEKRLRASTSPVILARAERDP
jgi:hypothetical protein